MPTAKSIRPRSIGYEGLDKAGIIVRPKYYYSGTVEFYSLVFTTE